MVPCPRLAVTRHTATVILGLSRTPEPTPNRSPLPTSFVVKKGSNILSTISLDIPEPVSETANSTYTPGRVPTWVRQ